MKRVAISTLGCKTNQFESAAMAESLGREGYELVPFDAEADLYIVNTCTVTGRTDSESRRLIRRAVRRNGAARVVVTGCYAQVAADAVKSLPGVSLVIGNAEKKSLVELLRTLDGEQQVLVSDIMAEERVEPLRLETFAEHTRAFLQVQNGCNAFCSYCIVPYARGRSRSVAAADVLAGIRRFAAEGFREVVLTGIHLGAYGLDLEPPRELLDLLTAVAEDGSVPRLRLGSVEPNEVTDGMIALLANSGIVCPHLHIPLQSGSDTVLARMNRRYSRAFVQELVTRLAAAVPDITIGMDVIAGFPGETDEEHAETVALLDALPIAYLHVFPYSSRTGTPAAAMSGHLPPAVITSRAAELRALGARKKAVHADRFVGKELPVLVQEMVRPGLVRGLSRNYLVVTLAGDEELLNREINVRVTGVLADGVRGERVQAGVGSESRVK
jgi:threonylcarbamoyladenosine tRNA methylthiotransferase MtaB